MVNKITEKLALLGIKNNKTVHYQLSPAELIELAVKNGEGQLSHTGALTIETGKFTGRSPKDRFIVKDAITCEQVNWNAVNQAFDVAHFDIIWKQVSQFLSERTVYLRDVHVVSASQYSKKVTLVTEQASQDLFTTNMFIASPAFPAEEMEWSVLVASSLQVPNYETLGLRASNCVLVDFTKKLILVVGTAYTGEIKKSVFSILNFLLPIEQGILPMHCSANIGKDGDAALFFGLSGTGKTTLSADDNRYLIGDDEHGWGDNSIFNFEGGCYAKCIGLTAEKEPEIFKAIRFGALVENVPFHPGSRIPNYDDAQITENMRVSYPLNHMELVAHADQASSPKHIFFLSADAFGVLPPISLLTREQAMYYFINGYTAKVAGTEMGITKPIATFSACFGQAFMPLHPMDYARLLERKLLDNPDTHVWLVNTGWIGGPYGVGRRIKLTYTRQLIRAALAGDLNEVLYTQHPIFDLAVPSCCPDIPSEILNPSATWENKEGYTIFANKLNALFQENYVKYEDFVENK